MSSTLFAAKVMVLRTRRGLKNLGFGPKRHQKIVDGGFQTIIAQSQTALRTDTTSGETLLQTGKIENLRIACRALDGTVIPAGEEFSMWRQLGAPRSSRGYVLGRMLQQGCMIPAIGGGLCQLSNALYDVALQAHCRIIERHAHSKIVPGSSAAFGRDATIAWNYVDLRFSPPHDIQLYARLTRDRLIIRLLRHANDLTNSAPVSQPRTEPFPAPSGPRNCHSCGESSCFRHSPSAASPPRERRAFLVDEHWPEFQKYVDSLARFDDVLGVPINGAWLRLRRYAWSMAECNNVRSASIAGVMRAVSVRGAASSGSARRATEIAGSGRIANSLARLLTPGIEIVTVAQSYLPYLHRGGALGGREVSVLMSRLPMSVLHARLDKAFADHPDRASLADFRAPAWLMALETEALAGAAHIVTPHAEIAAMFPDRAVLLPWRRPETSPAGARPGRYIVFPGPTAARKGAFAVRMAAMELGLDVLPLGSELEGPDFWAPVRVMKQVGWEDAAAVVQPSLVEDQPRALLLAMARGIPVMATSACGLPMQDGLTIIPPDDPRALIVELKKLAVPSNFRASAPCA